MRTSVITMIFLAASLSMLSADSTEEALYREVLSKTFTSAKMPAVRKLAELRTRAAEECLKRLMNDDDMWNSESGVNGLLLLKRESSARILFDGLMRGGITAGRIEEGMIDDAINNCFEKVIEVNAKKGVISPKGKDDYKQEATQQLVPPCVVVLTDNQWPFSLLCRSECMESGDGYQNYSTDNQIPN